MRETIWRGALAYSTSLSSLGVPRISAKMSPNFKPIKLTRAEREEASRYLDQMFTYSIEPEDPLGLATDDAP